MLTNYLKTAVRHFLKDKVYAFINLTGLSIGITTTIVLGIFIRYESSFDDFHANANDIYRVVQHTRFPERTAYWNTTAHPLAEAIRNDFPEFPKVTQVNGPTKRVFSADDGSGYANLFEEEFVLFADSLYPKVFDLGWIAGDPESALDHPNSIILTESAAMKCFGNAHDQPASLLGKTVMLNSKDPLSVTGIVKDPPGNVNLRYGIIVPYSFFKANNPYKAGNWSGNYQGSTFVLLDNHDRERELEMRIAGWKKKYLKPEDDARIDYFLQPLRDIHTETLYGNSPGGYVMPSKLLRAAAMVGIFILVIAAVNFVNLTTAQAITRAKEVGVRKALGSTRVHLIRQFVYEHALLILITLAVSIGLAQLAIDQVNLLLSVINLQLDFNWSDTGYIVLTGVVVILLAAVYPAIVLSSYRPAEALKNKIASARSTLFSFRRALIVLQFSTVQLLIIATIVVAVQVNHFRQTDLGFATNSIVMVPAPEPEKIEAFMQKLREEKDIFQVTFGSGPPLSVNGFQYGTSFRLPSQPVEEGQSAEMKITGVDYLSFFNLKLIAGRNFSKPEGSYDEFIVNETLLKSLGWTPEEAIGQKLVINEGEATVIGVIADYHNQPLQVPVIPCLFMNWPALRDHVFIQTENQASDPLPVIEALWKEFSPASVFRYSHLETAIDKEYVLENLVFLGFTLSSALAIVIGCLGLFGLSSFMALRKTKEIGIRKVLGATVGQLVSSFSMEFTWMILVAFVTAVPLAYWLMQRWLEGFANAISLSWWMFAAGGGIALAIALATVSFQSIKAALVNPVESLRNE